MNESVEACLTPRLLAVTDVFADMDAHWRIVDAVFAAANALDHEADAAIDRGNEDMGASLRGDADHLDRLATELQEALGLDPRTQ